MASETWSALTSRGTVLSTQLDSLANGSKSDKGASVDNATNKDRFAIARLTITGNPNTPTDESVIDLYMHPALAGGTYTDGTTNVDPAPERWVGQFTLQGTSALQVVDSPVFSMPPAPVKFQAVNRCGTTIPSSGAAVQVFGFNREVN